MSKVLFSPIGTSDPIRDLHDGPMLHIVRHYRPQAVYLFLTTEMEEIHDADDRYRQSIWHVDPECRIEVIRSGIREPHLFDRFVGVFSPYLEQVQQAWPGCEILLNVTSGTPQMILGLCLEAVLSRYAVQAVQVTTPARSANTKNHPVVAVDSLAELFSYNLDEDADAPNRCIGTNLSIMQKNNARQQLLSLIANYEYRSALFVVEQHGTVFPDEVRILLEHAASRSNLDTKAAKVWAEKYTGPVKLYPVQDLRAAKLTEFFMIMSMRQQQGEVADFIVKMTPFLYELTYTWLEDDFGFPFSKVIQNKDDRVDLDAEKVKRYDSRLWEQFNMKYNGKFGSRPLSFEHMLIILSVLASKQKENSSAILDNLQALEELRKYEERLRNKLAHTITMISEDIIHMTGVAIAKETVSNHRHMNSGQLFKDLESIMHKLLGNRCSGYTFVYRHINKRIEEVID